MTPQHAETSLVVTVVRTGGIAGLRREWRVEPDSDHRAEWLDLVEACPWGDEPLGTAVERDRFTWAIDALVRREHHRATLPEHAVTGPWRDLVDRTRAAGSRPRDDRERRRE